MGKSFLPKTDFPFKSYDKKLEFFVKNEQLLTMSGTREKNFIFSNPCGQLLQNFLHMFS
jgi:hypothetical protein